MKKWFLFLFGELGLEKSCSEVIRNTARQTSGESSEFSNPSPFLFLRLCSPATLGSSLLFHTGDVHYVRFLRTLASEAFGSHFDSQGLWRKSSDGNSINGWERIGGKEGHPNTHSEEEILDALG